MLIQLSQCLARHLASQNIKLRRARQQPKYLDTHTVNPKNNLGLMSRIPSRLRDSKSHIWDSESHLRDSSAILFLESRRRDSESHIWDLESRRRDGIRDNPIYGILGFTVYIYSFLYFAKCSKFIPIFLSSV